MCAGSLSLGVLGAVSGIGSSLAQSNATYQQQLAAYQREQLQNEILKKQTDDEARMRRAEAILNYQQLDTAQQETNETAANDAFNVRREMARTRALQTVASAGAGVTGNTVARLERALDVEQTFALNDIETNRVSAINQLQTQKIGVQLGAQVNPVYLAISDAPKRFSGSTLLNAALGGLNGYLSVGGFSGSGSSPQVSETAAWQVRNPNVSGVNQTNYVPLLGQVRTK